MKFWIVCYQVSWCWVLLECVWFHGTLIWLQLERQPILIYWLLLPGSLHKCTMPCVHSGEGWITWQRGSSFHTLFQNLVAIGKVITMSSIFTHSYKLCCHVWCVLTSQCITCWIGPDKSNRPAALHCTHGGYMLGLRGYLFLSVNCWREFYAHIDLQIS